MRELRARGFAIPEPALRRGLSWLAAAQGADGGWGGGRNTPASIEETALAVEALAGTSEVAAVDAGARWLVERVEAGAWREPAPIGFYFAKLWYYERLYPLIFTVGGARKSRWARAGVNFALDPRRGGAAEVYEQHRHSHESRGRFPGALGGLRAPREKCGERHRSFTSAWSGCVPAKRSRVLDCPRSALPKSCARFRPVEAESGENSSALKPRERKACSSSP